MNFNEQTHPFDEAVQLTEKSGVFYGHTSEHYANMVGPFGGTTAATLLNAAMLHPERIGEPISVTINYAAPIADGEFTVKATPARTNRSTQHWFLELKQKEETIITGTAVFAKRRETWSVTDIEKPSVPAPSEVEKIETANRPSFVKNYEMRIVEGPPFTLAEKEPTDSVTVMWMRDQPARPLDFLSLTALCDVFFPRIFVRREKNVPMGTVSLTVYFHADSDLLAEQGTREVLGETRALQYRNGYYDQTGEVWSADGKLLATTSQIVYYRE